MERSASSWCQNGVRKGQWTQEEDQKLVEFMAQREDDGNRWKWRNVPKVAGLNRCGKSCRLRWTNYLRPGIKRGKYSQEEDETIIHLHSLLGNKWSAIAKHLPGRTDNEIKNYWHADLTKRLVQKGIDPVTHEPRFDTNRFDPKNHDNLQHLLDAACNKAINNLITNPSQLRALRSHLLPDHNDIDKVIQMLNTILQLLKTSPCTSCNHDPLVRFAPREPTYNNHIHYEQNVYDACPNLVSSQAKMLGQEASNHEISTMALTPSVSLPMVSGLSECSRTKRKMNPNVDVSNFSSTLETSWEELWWDEEAWRQYIK